MGFFYLGPWAVEAAPEYDDRVQWGLPLNDEHVTDTSAPEDLMINPEDFDLTPEQSQIGETEWSDVPMISGIWYILGMGE